MNPTGPKKKTNQQIAPKHIAIGERHARHDPMGCWSASKAQRLNKRLMLGKGRRIAKSLRPGMKGSLDFKPCTTLDQRRGSAEWCTTLRTCTMGPIVECGFCPAWLKETMCESTASLPPPLAAESRRSVVYLCLSSQSMACALDNVFGVIDKQQGSDKSLETQSVKISTRANSNIANKLPPHPRDSNVPRHIHIPPGVGARMCGLP